MKQFKLLTMLALYIGFIAEIIAQSAGISTMPNNAKFYESYTVTETVEYLIPHDSILEKMTDWDWVDLRPKREVRQHVSYINENYDRITEWVILESNHANEWDHDIGRVRIEPNYSRLYDENDNIIFERERPLDELLEEAEFTQLLKNQGLFPQKAIVPYDQALIDPTITDLFSITQTNEGYFLSNEDWEISVNTDELIVVKRLLKDTLNTPYYFHHQFSLNDQDNLVPQLLETLTKIQSKSGNTLIQSERKQYSNSTLFYHPSILANEKIALASTFSISPNPVIGNLAIHYLGNSFNSVEYQIKVFDPTNTVRLRFTNLNTSNVESIDLSSLSQGFYLLQFNMQGHYFIKKIFKN